MFRLEEDNEKIGAYLKKLIDKNGYKTATAFCKDYLRLRNESADQLEKTKNRFSQIFKGKKSIQIHDLPILSNLLCVSCEEILSAGKSFRPTSTHVTNYDIAYSKDRKVWDEYMKRNDQLFLHCDEYYKTVIDYALEFKNYAFIKYLLDEGFIWFVDPTINVNDFHGYRADTSIKSNGYNYDFNRTSLSTEIQYQDRLRTTTIALAIENEDFDVLDSLRAREFPDMGYLSIFGNLNFKSDENRNDNLIEVIASTENKQILEYFSDEFIVQEFDIKQERKNSFLFLYLGDVIELMLKNKRITVLNYYYEKLSNILKKHIILLTI